MGMAIQKGGGDEREKEKTKLKQTESEFTRGNEGSGSEKRHMGVKLLVVGIFAVG
jgi:hypothetical protein